MVSACLPMEMEENLSVGRNKSFDWRNATWCNRDDTNRETVASSVTHSEQLQVKMKRTSRNALLQIVIFFGFGDCSENFKIKSENLNKRLVPYTFLEKIVKSHHDCVRECFNFGGQCKAINYNLRSRICELKSKGSVDSVDASEYEHTAGYIFSDITDWPTFTLSQCEDHNCLENQKCSPLGSTAYNCRDKADCGHVPGIEFATVIAWITTDGAEATYSCDFGYEFNSPYSKVTCKGGSWKANGPIACIPKDCGPLTDIQDGTKTVTETTHGGIATYTCNYGYQHDSGDLMRTCVDGTWDGNEPSCNIKDCGPLTDIPYGTKTVTETTHDGIATYTCNYGYKHDTGDLTRTCVDGTWDGNEPSCKITDCGPPSDIPDGTKAVTETTHGGTATYTCNYGYQHDTGDLTRTCVDGTWDGNEPSCNIKDCGEPSGVTHGSVDSPMTTHGSSATYTCDVEYHITSGDVVRSCLDGVWDGSIPVCSIKPNVGCYYAGQSSLFEGFRQTTSTGLSCQRWDSQYPHLHGNTSPGLFPSDGLSASENYCRDPDYMGTPWCYTTDPSVRWEYCDIPLCTVNDSD